MYAIARREVIRDPCPRRALPAPAATIAHFSAADFLARLPPTTGRFVLQPGQGIASLCATALSASFLREGPPPIPQPMPLQPASACVCQALQPRSSGAFWPR